MTKRHLVLSIPLAIALCVSMGPPSPADAPREEAKEGPNVSESTDAKEKPRGPSSDDAVARLALAHSLVSYGREAQSPTALITAAEILGQISTTPLEAKPETRSNAPEGEAPAQEEKPNQARSDNPEDLLAEARAMAAEDPHVAALADRVAQSLSEKQRGAIPGPKLHRDRVSANSTDEYRIVFRGGERAAVAVSGDGDTDLDLYVYDENGNLIGSDTDYSDDCVVTWYPKWTGPFVIHVRNRGSVYNVYSIATN